ncbi:MAG: YeeE/YedE family protein [Alphaproteobacteria bacterium]|jgi:hypothetical protein|nr:YeeE/YedE family protein [Alphaproteobacteria bacterium]MDP6566375.1 YeeE/YedE family protein [Alphaproteobacteria bacterium]
MDEYPIGVIVASMGFGLGIIFGITAQRSNFCTMGAISDVVLMGAWNRFRAWMLALAVALVASQGLQAAGAFELSASIYLSANLGWAGALIGGLLFGFGMTLAGGCANKTLVRLGAGNLKSLVVALVLGLFAYMTLRGLIALARVELEDLTMIDLTAAGLETQGIPDLLAATGLPMAVARWAAVAVIAGGLLLFCFKCSRFRAAKADQIAGLVIGLLVPAGWWITGIAGRDEFDPVPLASLTFVASIGDGIQYLMTFTGASINFGIAVVGGIIAGAFAAAWAAGDFRIESFTDAADMGRHLIGGALMGVGGVLALGCTIGQGITGMSTLAVGSVIALLAIIAGGVFGMKYQEEESLRGALAAILGR